MTAKKMFEKLGYEYSLICNGIIHEIKYEHKDEHGKIVFKLNYKVFYADIDDYSVLIDMPTFKAIHRQLEELGWLDE